MRRTTSSEDILPSIRSGEQTTDIDWNYFKNKTNQDVVITNSFGDGLTEVGKYYPVSPDYGLSYDGKGYNVSNINVDTNVNAGLFGEVPNNFRVSNLSLIDFNIKSSKNAGALLGKLTQSENLGTKITNVSNVVTYGKHSTIIVTEDTKEGNKEGTNEGDADEEDTNEGGTNEEDTNEESDYSIKNAGGLIGLVEGNHAKIEKSAAALIVSSKSGNAGGLIGTIKGGNVTACYSGGHTADGSYEKWVNGHSYDVTGTTAGGLIGNSSATISNSYSTCSVSGTTAGGFVGKASGNTTGCYSTGLIDLASITEENKHLKGAFAGVMKGIPSNFMYFEMITEVKNGMGNDTKFDHYLGAVGDSERSGIEKIDDISIYDKFVGSDSVGTSANAYDKTLVKYFRGTYNLRTVFQLPYVAGKTKSEDKSEDFVATHYGDWPAPEVFIFNTSSSSTQSSS